MKMAEFEKLLKAGEWNDVEFKEAYAAVPKSSFETVSAIANTPRSEKDAFHIDRGNEPRRNPGGLGLKDEKHFRENYQQVAVKLDLIETIPDKPRSNKQRYRLTEKDGGFWEVLDSRMKVSAETSQTK